MSVQLNESQLRLARTIEGNFPASLRLLAELVDQNSFSLNVDGVNKVQARLATEFNSLGMSVELRRTNEGSDVLIARTPAATAQSYTLLLGHADTVHPPESNFKKFSLEGDVARGPGVWDMKGGLVVMLEALRALARDGKLAELPIVAMVTPDEERTSTAGKPHILELGKDAHSALVFEFGRDNNCLITQRKGICVYKLEVEGKAAHSGNSHKQGVSAIVEISRVIVALQGQTNYEEGTTVNVGLLKGGSAVNTVSASAEADFEVRSIRAAGMRQVEALFPSLIADAATRGSKVKFTCQQFAAPLEETPQSRVLFSSIQEASILAGDRWNLFPGIVGGVSEANVLAEVGVPTVDALGPQGSGAHEETEQVKISSFVPKMKSLAFWLLNSSGRNFRS